MAFQLPKFIKAVFSAPKADSAFRDSAGNTYLPSSFGVADTTFGPGWSSRAVFMSQRRRELEWRRQFFEATTHDAKSYDMDGRLIAPGVQTTQPFVGGAIPSVYVPLDARRPSVPYRLATTIVKRFTSRIFGRDHFPTIEVVGDPDTQDWFAGVVDASSLRTRMIRARNMGGACGSVALSWRVCEGVPRVQVHAGSCVEVVEWADREELVPAHAIELTRRPEDRWDPDKRSFERVWWWCRRDWTPMADLYFLDKLDDSKGREEPWVLDRTRTDEHKDGEAHVVWVQNDPDDGVDGRPDYDGQYEALNSLDTSSSVAHRGTVLNLDPTLVLNADPEIVKRGGVIRKGSDNALTVGENGGAEYLELSGSSVAAGKDLIERERGQILECVSCVVPDPNTVAAAGTSSLGIRLVYEPMLDEVDVRREQYGQGMVRLLGQIERCVRRRLGNEEGVPVYEVAPDGTETPVIYEVKLEPKVIDVLDANGKPTGEVKVEPRRLGKGGTIKLKWGEDFSLTADEESKRTSTLSTAAGGKPVVSHKSAVERASKLHDLDPREEWKRVEQQTEAELKRAAAKEESVFGTADVALPPVPDAAVADQSQVLELAPTDIAKIVTVNEARASVGLAPIPGGDITVAEFFARQQAKAEEEGAAAGAAMGELIHPTPPKPPPPAQPPLPGAPGGAAGPSGQGAPPAV